MSKLLDLFNGSEYARLNNLPSQPASPTSQTFSARNQSNTAKETRQTNAVDFFGNTYQSGFNVDKTTLSVYGFRKADAAQSSDYSGAGTSGVNSGTAGVTVNAFDTYNRFATDSIRNQYLGKEIHKFLATNAQRQYLSINSTLPGAKLIYNV